MKTKVVTFLIFFICCYPFTNSLCQTISPLGYGLQKSGDGFYAPHLAKLDTLIFISGSFEYADSVKVNNIAIWDGQTFRDANYYLEDPVADIFNFQDTIFAWIDKYLDGDRLLYWNNNSWEDYIEFSGRLNGITIHQNRMYLYGDQLSLENIEPNSIIYYESGSWNKIEIDWSHPWNDYKEEVVGLAIWNEQLVISPNFMSGVSIVDSLGELTWLDESLNGFSFCGKLYSFLDKLFLVEDPSDKVYEYVEGNWNLLLENGGFAHGFYMLKNELYLGIVNEGTFIYKDDGFSLHSNEWFQIFDMEFIEKDNLYLIVGNLNPLPGNEVIFNNIAIMTYETPIFDIAVQQDTICENEYIYFQAIDSDMTIEYDWEFIGGLPVNSNQKFPVIKYSNPGSQTIMLNARNAAGFGNTIYYQVEVKAGCKVDRSNRYDNVWLMGRPYSKPRTTAGIDFSNGSPISCAFNTPINFWGLSNSISDKEGNLLFYSDGMKLLDSNHRIIENSEDFNSDAFIEKYGYEVQGASQGLITIPSKEHDSIFYLFHAPIDLVGEDSKTLPTKLLMSQIEITDSSILKMTIKGLPIIEDTLQNFTMQAHPHSNGDDWWILIPEYNSDQIYKVLLYKDGTIEVDKQSLGINMERSRFQSVFSPNGQYFAITSRKSLETYIWNFNSSDGFLDNLRIIKPNEFFEGDENMGCAFSPNSRFLYVSSYHYMRQYDLCEENVSESEILVGEWDGMYTWIYPFSFARMMLGPDDKIYVACYASSEYMSTIHEPNLKGLDCRFLQHDLEARMDNIFDSNTVPDYPHYRNNLDSLDCTTLKAPEIALPNVEVEVIPNPSFNTVTLISNIPLTGYKFKIIDIQGNILTSGILNNEKSHKIELNEMVPGIHFIMLTKEDHKLCLKLIRL